MIRYFKSFAFVLVLSALVGVYQVNCQVEELQIEELLRNLKCIGPQLLKDFDLNKFQGRWYDIKTFQVLLPNIECVSVLFSKFNETNYVASFTGKPEALGERTISVPFTIPDQNMKNKLKMELNAPNMQSFDFYILDTDYSHYAITYACINNMPNIWILGRQRKLDQKYLSKAEESVKKFFKIDFARLPPSRQENCPAIKEKSN